MGNTIAITGAAGNVGTGLRAELRNRGFRLVLLDIAPVEDVRPEEQAHVVDIGDQPRLTELLKGVDTLVHLAACTSDAEWASQVKLSIEGTISLYEAVRGAGVPRVVYASSHHVVGLHPREPVMTETAILRPDSRYGVGKAFGESIGALYAYKYGVKVLNIRIGNVNTRPLDRRRLGSWLSWRDLGQLVDIGARHPGLVYEIVYGISDATERNYDNRAAYALGYRPEDSFESHLDDVLRDDPAPQPDSPAAETPAELTLGGEFSSSEFEGASERIFLGPLFERLDGAES